MKGYLVWGTVLSMAAAGYCLDFEGPEIGAEVIMEYIAQSGDSAYTGQGIFLGASDRFNLRKVSVGVAGRAGALVTYDAEAAVASCAGGQNLTIHEAGIYLEPENSFFRLGMGQLHARRGYTAGEECGHTLLLEKPVWQKTLSPQCHSIGGLFEFNTSLGSAGDLSGQAGCFNGANGSFEDEWDITGWLRYSLPFAGLSAGGFIERMHLEMDPLSEGIESAARAGFGVNMDNGGVHCRMELISMEGVPMASRPEGCQERAQDVENTGLLIQGGYLLDSALPVDIRPYAGYQVWDRWSNSVEGDYRFSWVEAGVQVKMDHDSWMTLAWRGPTATPEGSSEDSSVAVLRFGTEI